MINVMKLKRILLDFSNKISSLEIRSRVHKERFSIQHNLLCALNRSIDQLEDHVEDLEKIGIEDRLHALEQEVKLLRDQNPIIKTGDMPKIPVCCNCQGGRHCYGCEYLAECRMNLCDKCQYQEICKY